MMLDIDGYSCAGPCLSILLLNRREKGDKKANNTLKGRKRDGKVETEKKRKYRRLFNMQFLRFSLIQLH